MAISLQEALNYDVKKAEDLVNEDVLSGELHEDNCDADHARKALDVVEVLQAEVKRLTTQTRGIAELLILCVTGEESCVPEPELDQWVSTRQAILTALSLKDELASEKILAYCSVAATNYDANRTFKALRELISEGRITLKADRYSLVKTGKK